jgi:hypothetical protein
MSGDAPGRQQVVDVATNFAVLESGLPRRERFVELRSGSARTKAHGVGFSNKTYKQVSGQIFPWLGEVSTAKDPSNRGRHIGQWRS